MEFKNNFDKLLKNLRKEKGLTQKEVAKGSLIPLSMISKYEQGINKPNYENLYKLITFYKVDFDYFINLTTEVQKNEITSFLMSKVQYNLNEEEIGKAKIFLKKISEITTFHIYDKIDDDNINENETFIIFKNKDYDECFKIDNKKLPQISFFLEQNITETLKKFLYLTGSLKIFEHEMKIKAKVIDEKLTNLNKKTSANEDNSE